MYPQKHYITINYIICFERFYVLYEWNYTRSQLRCWVAVYCKWSGYSGVAIRKVTIVLPSGRFVVETTVFCHIRLYWPLLCKPADWCTYFKQMNRDKSTHANGVGGVGAHSLFFANDGCQQRTQTITGTKKAQFPLSSKWLIVQTREQLQMLQCFT